MCPIYHSSSFVTMFRVFAVASVLFLSGCGGSQSGSEGAAPAHESGAEGTAPAKDGAARLLVTEDSYGISTPNLLYQSANPVFSSLQLAVAQNEWDPGYRNIIRIDLPREQEGLLHGTSASFAIGGSGPAAPFPGMVYLFNGHPSTLMQVDSGTVSFSHNEGQMVLNLDLQFVDRGSTLVPAPRYRIVAEMHSGIGSGGRPLMVTGGAEEGSGELVYNGNCAPCHRLGSYDDSGEAADLSQRGGELPLVFPGSIAEHRQSRIDAEDMKALKVMLNAW